MTWEVEMCRISEGFATFQVEAATYVDALTKAYEVAGDKTYKEHTANYEVNYCVKAKKKE